MTRVTKLVLVTAEHHPLHKHWVRLAEELSKKLGVELEVRIEDYVLLNECGEKDEFGMAWLPQLLAYTDDGKCHLVLSRMPVKGTQPDVEAGLKEAEDRLKSIMS